jgi:hypothetical protein
MIIAEITHENKNCMRITILLFSLKKYFTPSLNWKSLLKIKSSTSCNERSFREFPTVENMLFAKIKKSFLSLISLTTQ